MEKEITNQFLRYFKDLKLNSKNCVRQNYDNGTDMAGKYNGMQAF